MRPRTAQDPAAWSYRHQALPNPHTPDGAHLRWVEIDILGTAVLVPRDCRLVIEALLDVQSSQLILGGEGRSAGPGKAPPCQTPAASVPATAAQPARGQDPRSQPASPRPSLPGHGNRRSLVQARPPPSRGSGGTGPSRPATTGTEGSLPPPQPRGLLTASPGTATPHPGSPRTPGPRTSFCLGSCG